jgi:hypothetical protein
MLLCILLRSPLRRLLIQKFIVLRDFSIHSRSGTTDYSVAHTRLAFFILLEFVLDVFEVVEKSPVVLLAKQIIIPFLAHVKFNFL